MNMTRGLGLIAVFALLFSSVSCGSKGAAPPATAIKVVAPVPADSAVEDVAVELEKR